MSTFLCKKCKNQVTNNAAFCPHCGFRNIPSLGSGGWLIGIAAIAILAGYFTGFIGKPQQEPSTQNFKQPTVILVQSEVFHKRKSSTGSDRADWKIHLKNESDKKKNCQLWIYGYDKDGFQCYENLYEVMTTLEPKEERKVYHEIFFNVGEFDRVFRLEPKLVIL